MFSNIQQVVYKTWEKWKVLSLAMYTCEMVKSKSLLARYVCYGNLLIASQLFSVD